MLLRLAIATLLVTAATACKHNKKANTTVRNRAAFDFSCPKDELELRVIDTEGARKLASLIAVHGCGQKAVYAYYPDSNTWVIDGVVTPLPEGYEMQPHVTKGKDKQKEDKRAAKAQKHGKMNETSAAPAEPAPAEAAPDAPAEAPAPDSE